MRGADFNYKVALASGLKSLQAGQLDKAEEQFRYLRDKFSELDGGYRGLARVATERAEPAAALAALREGAAALARAGERAGAIGLLREILALEPLDHAAHRRLVAALILAGDRAGAIEQYRRYTRLVLSAPGGSERARLEAAYAREQLGEALSVEDASPPAGEAGAGEPGDAAPIPHPPADLEAQALRAIADRDALGAGAIVEAAREHLAGGRASAAADLLLAAIAAGVATREAERLLVEVERATGGDAVARERSALLARVEALDESASRHDRDGAI